VRAIVDRRIANYVVSALVGAVIAPTVSFPIAEEPGRPAPGLDLVTRKGADADRDEPESAQPMPTRASLVGLHTGEIVVLSNTEPSVKTFSWLLRDRVTGEVAEMAPRLLELLRQVAPGSRSVRIEIVSGYRSWKLNEMLRKKGHNVASRSQHCLGKAMDFRVEGMSSKELADAIEANRWRGGLAHYPGDTDRFVHADVGPNRRWRGR